MVLRCALAKECLYRTEIANELMSKFGTAEALYAGRCGKEASRYSAILERAFSVGNLDWAEKEVEWCNSKGIRLLFRGERDFPALLSECNDAPFMLYYKGTADLNNPRSVSIVGTRLASAYGKEGCSIIIGHLAEYMPLVVSGLAYGIDITAHREALEAELDTVAVLPNGMDMIYPSRHRDIAVRMAHNGGLLTEFPRGEVPRKMNFIRRNRIIAAMTQAVIVVESRVKGGSMITAELAGGYGRDVFALPGRITDSNSFGCNYLISKNVAAVYNCASAVPSALGWDRGLNSDALLQPQLFSFDIDKKEKILLSLNFDNPVDVERLTILTGLDWGEVSMLLLELELEGKVSVHDNMGYSLKR